jgi:hypothetical protein
MDGLSAVKLTRTTMVPRQSYERLPQGLTNTSGERCAFHICTQLESQNLPLGIFSKQM